MVQPKRMKTSRVPASEFFSPNCSRLDRSAVRTNARALLMEHQGMSLLRNGGRLYGIQPLGLMLNDSS